MKNQKVPGGSPPVFHYPSIQKAGRMLIDARDHDDTGESKEITNQDFNSDHRNYTGKGEVMVAGAIASRFPMLDGVLHFISRFRPRRKKPYYLMFHDIDEMREYRREVEKRRSYPFTLI